MTPDPHTRDLEHVDVAGAPVVRWCFLTSLVWLFLGSVFGDVVSLKFQFPDWLQQWGITSFGRLRPAHLSAMIYGWASIAMLGVALWIIPRLVHAPLRWPRLALAGLVLWNIGVAIGIVGLLVGRTDGLEWLEMDRALVRMLRAYE